MTLPTPALDAPAQPFTEELDRLLQHLGCAHWTPEPVPELSTVAWFSEPRVTT